MGEHYVVEKDYDVHGVKRKLIKIKDCDVCSRTEEPDCLGKLIWEPGNKANDCGYYQNHIYPLWQDPPNKEKEVVEGMNKRHIDFKDRELEHCKIGHFYLGRYGEKVECVGFNATCWRLVDNNKDGPCHTCPGTGRWKREDGTIFENCAWGGTRRFYTEIPGVPKETITEQIAQEGWYISKTYEQLLQEVTGEQK